MTGASGATPPADGDLARLLAEAAIGRVLARYATGVDRLDLELVRSCYHPDATEDRGRFRGGVDEFVAWLEQTVGEMESAWHLQGIPLIELDGDVAYVETYCLGIVRSRSPDGGAQLVRHVPCRYCDRFERRAGEWLIARRIAVYEPATVATAEAAPLGRGSRRDRDDAAYQRD